MALEIPGVRDLVDVQQTPQQRDPDEALGRTAFLGLMIAQISNQNPLEPAKNEAFVAQLAQFSSLEGIQNLNESMDTLVSSLRSGIAMDAAGLVGRNVLVPTTVTALNNLGGIGGTVDVDRSVPELTVEITNTTGNVVHRQELGPQTQGNLRFNWDGLLESGDVAAQDRYAVRAYSTIDGVQQPFLVNLPDQVVSVSIEEGGLVANLAGGGSVTAAQIKEIQ